MPSNILSLVQSKQQQQQQQHQHFDGKSWGECGDGDRIILPAAKRSKNDKNNGDRKLANTHNPSSDAWSAPEGVSNPIATYFPDTAAGNVK